MCVRARARVRVPAAQDRNKIRGIERLFAPTAFLADKIQQGQITSVGFALYPLRALLRLSPLAVTSEFLAVAH